MTIFVPPQDIEKKKGIRLNADKSHYLASVLRSKKGTEVTVIDGRGKAYKAIVSGISKGSASIDIEHEVIVDTESPTNLVLCQGILKGEKMAMLIQKTTELGVKEIVPLITDRSVIRETRKVDRWRKIAEEAAEQCGRAVIPLVHEPEEIRSFFSRPGLRIMRGFVFWEEGGLHLSDAAGKVFQGPVLESADLPVHPFIHSPICLLIGPEGGFSETEVRVAEECGLVRTTFGKRILRAETGAIVALALVQYLAGIAADSGHY